jgi:hypothetical protein
MAASAVARRLSPSAPANFRMPSVTFFATRVDLLDVVRFAGDDCGCRVMEAYSRFDSELREFASAHALEDLEELGTSSELQLALWHPASGPAPRHRRVDLRPGAVPGRTHRYTVEGCSVLTLQCGGIRGDVLTASSLGWWTEAGARAKAAAELGAADVNWPALTSLARRIRYHITRRLAHGSARGRPVLTSALELARRGARLKDPHQPAADLTLDSA